MFGPLSITAILLAGLFITFPSNGILARAEGTSVKSAESSSSQTETDRSQAEPAPGAEDTAPSQAATHEESAISAPQETGGDRTPPNGLVEASGLIFQPPYYLVKLGIATVGTIATGVVWAASLGNDEPAKSIWAKTTSGPWAWHGWIRNEGDSTGCKNITC